MFYHTTELTMTTFNRYIAPFLLLLLLSAIIAKAETPPAQNFMKGLELLSSKDFSKKKEAISYIGQSKDQLAEITLVSLLNGDLYFTKKDKVLVRGTKEGRNVVIIDHLTGEDLGKVSKRKLKKITINNTLRGLLKTAIAQLNLTNTDERLRLKAVEAVMSNLTPEIQALLPSLYENEKSEAVKDQLLLAIAVGGLRSESPDDRIKALETVEGSLNPLIRNEVNTLLANESSDQVKKKAEKIVAAIDTKISLYNKLETLFFGLSAGSVLVLAAIGLAITFGVIGVINMAHGELIMIGAYTTYVLQQLLPNSIGWALALAVPCAFCVSGLVGIIIERSVIRFLYGRPLETLLATFGISLILQQTVRSIFSPLNRSVSTPQWMSGSIDINPVLSLTTNRVTIFIFAMVVFGLLFLLLKKSSLGLHVRAVSQNRSMARAMGVKAARVDALTFGLGSGIAGIAGVALSQLTNVGPNLGQSYIIDSFMVVVFGGVGNLWGTLLGGLSLGIANKYLEPWSGAVLAKIFILVFIILFIQKRPQGLFPQKGRAAE